MQFNIYAKMRALEICNLKQLVTARCVSCQYALPAENCQNFDQNRPETNGNLTIGNTIGFLIFLNYLATNEHE